MITIRILSLTPLHRSKRAMTGLKWTIEEHKQFLEGLQRFGRGNWKAISVHYVSSRTTSQVASHAQKYFLRLDKKKTTPPKKLRSSILDVSSDSEESRTNQSPDDDQQSPKRLPVRDGKLPTQVSDALHAYTQCALMCHRIEDFLTNHPYMRPDVTRPHGNRGAIKNLDILL